MVPKFARWEFAVESNGVNVRTVGLEFVRLSFCPSKFQPYPPLPQSRWGPWTESRAYRREGGLGHWRAARGWIEVEVSAQSARREDAIDEDRGRHTRFTNGRWADAPLSPLPLRSQNVGDRPMALSSMVFAIIGQYSSTFKDRSSSYQFEGLELWVLALQFLVRVDEASDEGRIQMRKWKWKWGGGCTLRPFEASKDKWVSVSPWEEDKKEANGGW